MYYEYRRIDIVPYSTCTYSPTFDRSVPAERPGPLPQDEGCATWTAAGLAESMGDAQNGVHDMSKPQLNSFVPGGDHAHLAAAISKKFAFRSTLEWCCAVALGMMFVYWVVKTVYYAPKSMPPEYKRYREQAYRRRLLAEVERQQQLRQRKGEPSMHFCLPMPPRPAATLLGD